MTQAAAAREGIKPYSPGQRIGYGPLWAFWTIVLVIAAFSGHGFFATLFCLVLAFFAGRYDYRIWTWQAKRLWFFIIF
jgi:hypothetical protein